MSALRFAAVALAGCSAIPGPAHPTGEPLRIDAHDDSYSALVAEPVSQATVADATGQRIGSVTVTENRVVQVRTPHWRARQGAAVIADEDLLRFAGDFEAADLDHSYRRNGRLMAYVGGAIAIAGLAELLAARQQGWTDSSAAQAAAYVSYGGLVGGVLLLVFGAKHLDADRHVVSQERAEDAAQRYNQSHHLAAPDVTRSLSFAPSLVEAHGAW